MFIVYFFDSSYIILLVTISYNTNISIKYVISYPNNLNLFTFLRVSSLLCKLKIRRTVSEGNGQCIEHLPTYISIV